MEIPWEEVNLEARSHPHTAPQRAAPEISPFPQQEQAPDPPARAGFPRMTSARGRTDLIPVRLRPSPAARP